MHSLLHELKLHVSLKNALLQDGNLNYQADFEVFLRWLLNESKGWFVLGGECQKQFPNAPVLLFFNVNSFEMTQHMRTNDALQWCNLELMPLSYKLTLCVCACVWRLSSEKQTLQTPLQFVKCNATHLECDSVLMRWRWMRSRPAFMETKKKCWCSFLFSHQSKFSWRDVAPCKDYLERSLLIFFSFFWRWGLDWHNSSSVQFHGECIWMSHWEVNAL